MWDGKGIFLARKCYRVVKDMLARNIYLIYLDISREGHALISLCQFQTYPLAAMFGAVKEKTAAASHFPSKCMPCSSNECPCCTGRCSRIS